MPAPAIAHAINAPHTPVACAKLRGIENAPHAQVGIQAHLIEAMTHSTDIIEHPELVSLRIQRFANLVGKENVIAGTDCGFGGRTHPQIAWAKLRALVAGAKLATEVLKFA